MFHFWAPNLKSKLLAGSKVASTMEMFDVCRHVPQANKKPFHWLLCLRFLCLMSLLIGFCALFCVSDLFLLGRDSIPTTVYIWLCMLEQEVKYGALRGTLEAFLDQPIRICWFRRLDRFNHLIQRLDLSANHQRDTIRVSNWECGQLGASHASVLRFCA